MPAIPVPLSIWYIALQGYLYISHELETRWPDTWDQERDTSLCYNSLNVLKNMQMGKIIVMVHSRQMVRVISTKVYLQNLFAGGINMKE